MYYHNMGNAQLGKFGFKKIKRAVKSVARSVVKAPVSVAKAAAKITTGVALAAPIAAIKGAGKVVNAAAPVAGSLLTGLTSGLMPASPGGSDSAYSLPGSYPQGGAGTDSGYGPDAQDSGLPFGLSPLTLGLMAGVPLLLFLFMKKK